MGELKVANPRDGVVSNHGAESGAAARPLTLLESVASGRPNPLLVKRLWERFNSSALRKGMLEGERYFLNEGDIRDKKRTIIGEYGNVEEYKEGVVSNSRIRHPDYRTFVRQKVTYLMSRPFSIQCANESVQKVLEERFGEGVRATIRELTAKVVTCGRAPLEVFYDKEGNMDVRVLEPSSVDAYYSDKKRERLLAAVRKWEEEVVEPDYTIKAVTHYDFYNSEGVWHFVTADDGTVQADLSLGMGGWDANFYTNVPAKDSAGRPIIRYNPETNQVEQSTELVGNVFAAVPVLIARYNDTETPLLNFVKSIVDAYDKDVSGIDDEIQDVPNSIKVIKGYNGENLGELVHNLRLFRAVSVQADGGVEEVGRDMDSTAAENHLTRLRKDMYSAASCVDTTRVDNLGNQSGVAMRYIYSDLDMDCMELWMDLEKQVLKPLARFFLYDHYLKTGEALPDAKVDFIPNTDISVNETETCLNIKNSIGIVSRETLLANHPYVTDVSEELARVKKEREEEMALLAQDGVGALGGSTKSPKEITSARNGEKGE